MAAHVLARKGRQVLLVDVVPRHTIKVGEALPGAALRLLRALSLPVPDGQEPHTPIGGNLSSWGSEDLAATDFFHDPDGRGWRLDRFLFDAELREAATSSGAGFKQARVLEAERESEAWRIKLDNGEIVAARWLIDATGRSSSLARRAGAKWQRDAPLTALFGIGQPQKEFRLNRTMVEAVPQGWWYAGLLPSGSPIVGLHLLPQDAGQFAASSAAWKKAMMETCHISAAFGGVTFNFPLRALDASGGRLSHFTGDGWLACGDAAMSFDPISAQGIVSALHSGMMAGMAIHGILEGDPTALNSYNSRLEDIRRIYLSRCRSIYQSETRWSNNHFWLQLRQPEHLSERSSFRSHTGLVNS
ncbi:MAG: fad dependent oxidoreductase [Acidobacteriaceae bacterium]|nr:fad dependent oxidoreductase [Acidobacteriaceae bacterium]